MKESTLSTIVSAPVKEAVTRFCRQRGLKLRHFIEQALIEQLEDEIDLEAYKQRQHEPTIPLETILRERNRKARR